MGSSPLTLALSTGIGDFDVYDNKTVCSEYVLSMLRTDVWIVKGEFLTERSAKETRAFCTSLLASSDLFIRIPICYLVVR